MHISPLPGFHNTVWITRWIMWKTPVRRGRRTFCPWLRVCSPMRIHRVKNRGKPFPEPAAAPPSAPAPAVRRAGCHAFRRARLWFYIRLMIARAACTSSSQTALRSIRLIGGSPLRCVARPLQSLPASLGQTLVLHPLDNSSGRLYSGGTRLRQAAGDARAVAGGEEVGQGGLQLGGQL